MAEARGTFGSDPLTSPGRAFRKAFERVLASAPSMPDEAGRLPAPAKISISERYFSAN